MRTSYQIYCDYLRAMNVASTLESASRNIRRVGQRYLTDEIENLAQKWQGEPIAIAREKGAQIMEDVSEDASGLMNLASTIRTIARRNYNAEMRALEIARAREGSGR